MEFGRCLVNGEFVTDIWVEFVHVSVNTSQFALRKIGWSSKWFDCGVGEKGKGIRE